MQGFTYFFLFLFQTIVLNVPTIYVLSKNKKNIKIFQLKILNFRAKKISVYCMGKFLSWEKDNRYKNGTSMSI